MRGLRTALPIVAIVVLVLGIGAIVWSSRDTLGYDYAAYVGAARRILDGQPLYDAAVDVAGGFAIYLYPPPFALALLPFAVLPSGIDVWLWEGLTVAAFVAAVAILPVRPTVRWVVLLLGALDWPVLYTIKLGQVGALLLLLFAIGWRWRDRAPILGAAIAGGALVKVQPVILIGWALLTGRWRAAAIAIGLLAVSAVIATVWLGPSVWSDYVALLGRVSSPVTTPHNFTPGAIAFQAGVAEGTAGAIQLAWLVAVVAVVLVSIRFGSDEVSYLTTVVASQVLSPLVWDHYALVLLLPTAWLLQRGQWWAVAIPLLTSILLVGVVPAAIYPIVFAVGLVAPLAVEWLGRRTAPDGAPGAVAGTAA